jgi:hypothetical protein
VRTAGIAAGLVVLVAAALLAIATVLSLTNETTWTDLDPGDCFDLAGALADADGDLAEVTAVDTIDCDDPHDAEVVAAGDLNPDGDRDYPTDPELFAEIDRECASLVPRAVDPDLADRFGIVPIAPDGRTWDDRGGRFVCVAVVAGGGTVTGSALG